MSKSSYTGIKRIQQPIVYSHIKAKGSFSGLCGSSLEFYIKDVEALKPGRKRVLMYDTNKNLINRYKAKKDRLTHLNLKLFNKCISKGPPTRIYDLDFCKTLLTVSPIVFKIMHTQYNAYSQDKVLHKSIVITTCKRGESINNYVFLDMAKLYLRNRITDYNVIKYQNKQSRMESIIINWL